MPDTSEEKPGFVTLANVIPMGFEQLTGAGVKTLTIPPGSDKALIQVEINDIRVRDDGTAPTANIGVLIKTTDTPMIWEADLTAFKYIQILGAAPIVNILYYKNKGSN